MGLIVDMLSVVVVTVVALVIHYLGALIFPAMEAATVGDISIYDGASAQQGMAEAVTVWVPLLLIGGAFAIATWRAYQRQRLVAGGPPV